jgi:1,4-alpha-glucan branching enzyme
MGANVVSGGVAFRVWAPHAHRVWVSGSFNAWSKTSHELSSGEGGHWQLIVPGASRGDEYQYILDTPEEGIVWRGDPYAREVTSTTGNSVVEQTEFDWSDDNFQIASWNELVIYELHVGTFNDADQESNEPGGFSSISSRLRHLQKLGINAIEIMPVAEFAGERSWGYNPAHPFSVELSYGGSVELKQFVKLAHQHGIAVILDVVYNHFGPSDLGLWRFDGWSENGGGGIYFYNDERGVTPWGHTRPDYGRGEVRQYIRDNVMMWLEDYRLDGLRFDATEYIHSIDGDGKDRLDDGWSLMQWLTKEVAERFPHRLMVAEDMQHNEWLTKDRGAGGAGFGAQWDADFVRELRHVAITSSDSERSIDTLARVLSHRFNDDAFERVIFSESHDAVANGDARVPEEISPGDPTGWFSQKRSTLAAAIVFTTPGIPMLFQGQEFLEGGWFRDDVPVDWDQREDFHGILRLYRDLVHLRRNTAGATRGLGGQLIKVTHANDNRKIIAFHRRNSGGPGDDVMVVANFLFEGQDNYTLGFPRPGKWSLRFNSDWQGYSDQFGGHPSGDVIAVEGAYDGLPYHAEVSVGPYSALIYSQVPE